MRQKFIIYMEAKKYIFLIAITIFLMLHYLFPEVFSPLSLYTATSVFCILLLVACCERCNFPKDLREVLKIDGDKDHLANNKIKVRNLTLLVLVASILLRIYILSGLPPGTKGLVNDYPDTLEKHFFDYVTYSNLTPPLNYIFDYLAVLIFGKDGVTENYGYVYLNYTFDIIAIFFLIKIFSILKIPNFISLILATIFSIGIISLELWRSNYTTNHYEHYSFVLLLLFLYSVINLIINKSSLSNLILVGVSTSLLLLQLSTAIFTVPFILLILLFFPFLLTLLIIIGKNYINTDNLSLGGRGGAALMMVVLKAFDNDPAEVRKIIIESGAPDWYLSCYDSAKGPKLENKSDQKYWDDTLSKSFGICMPWASTKISGVPWPFDMGPLIAQLNNMGQQRLSSIVEKDQYDSINRQYRFTGYSPELSLRWTSIYCLESIKVAKYLIIHHPIKYYNIIKYQYQEIFYKKGVVFIATIANGLDTWKYPLQNKIFGFNSVIFSKITIASYILLPIAFISIVLLRLMRSKYSNFFDENMKIYLILIVPIFISSAVYSSIVGGENDRYFLHIVPILFVALGLMVRDMRSIIFENWP